MMSTFYHLLSLCRMQLERITLYQPVLEMKMGYQAIAITDECSFTAIVKAHEAAKKHKVKLLVGAVFQLAEGKFVLLAMVRRGYGQFSQLLTNSTRRAVKGEYHLQFSELNQGLE